MRIPKIKRSLKQKKIEWRDEVKAISWITEIGERKALKVKVGGTENKIVKWRVKESSIR